MMIFHSYVELPEVSYIPEGTAMILPVSFRWYVFDELIWNRETMGSKMSLRNLHYWWASKMMLPSPTCSNGSLKNRIAKAARRQATWKSIDKISSWYPLVMTNIAVENHHAINGRIHYKWPFSIAMFNYQRLYPIHNPLNHYKVLWKTPWKSPLDPIKPPLNHHKITIKSPWKSPLK